MSDKAQTFIDQAALDNIKKETPGIIAGARFKAKLKKAEYLAFIDAGFDKKEALELCKDVK